MESYMDLDEAAAHAGVTVSYLKDQCRKGAGPKHFRPSPKKTLFRKADIDDWVKLWAVIDNNRT
jgi:Helix-turn-helix domain